MAIPRGEWGYIEAARAGMPFGNGPKENISRTVIGVNDIPFGRMAFAYKGDDHNVLLPVADTNTLTLDGVLVEDNVITLTINGVAYAETWDTDSPTTLDNLVDQLNAADAIYSASVATLVLTITTKAAAITATGVITLGASQATITPGTAAVSGDLIMVGPAIGLQKETQSPTYDDASYAPAEVASLMSLGDIVIETDDTAPDANTICKVLVSVVGVGKFTSNDTSSNAVAIQAVFKESVPDSSTLFVVHLQGGATPIA